MKKYIKQYILNKNFKLILFSPLKKLTRKLFFLAIWKAPAVLYLIIAKKETETHK